MADIVHARDDLATSNPNSSRTTSNSQGNCEHFSVERQDQPPRTDVGTLTLHWVTAIAFIVSLFTGIRIAADALNAPVSHWLNPILPQGEIWTWHFLAGLALFFCAAAYLIYMRRSGLANRNALKKTRVMVMPAANKMRFGGLNVLLHWAAYLIITIMTVTGIFLYLGYGGWLVQVHSYTAFVGLSYILIHAVAHYLYGGWWQVFRVFRPAKLVLTAAVKPKPLLIAAGVGVAVTAAVAATDWATRDTLVITKVEGEPKLDGVTDEALWNKARPVTINTQQGENFGGSGESTVEVRAVHNGEKVFFAIRWTDPTRSLRRIPMIKKEDGWHVADSRAGMMDVVDFYEDKLAVIFSDKPAIGGAGVSNLGPAPLPSDKPKPLNERGFHFTTDGSYRRHVAVEGLARRHARPGRRPVYRPAARRERRRGRLQGALSGRLLERSGPRLLLVQLQALHEGLQGPGGSRAPAEGLEEDAGWARQVHARSERQRRRERVAGASTSTIPMPTPRRPTRRSRSAP